IGDPTTQVFPPHTIWWMVFQLGTGLGVNGAQYSPSMDIDSLTNTQTMRAGNYGLFLLSDSDGENAAPAGSWMSKIIYGCDYSSGNAVLPYALDGTLPLSDDDIINGSDALGSGLSVYGRWLCGDGSAGTLPNTGSLGSASLSVVGEQLTIGPY